MESDLNALQKGHSMCGLAIDLNYKNGYVDISMLIFVANCLHRYQDLLGKHSQSYPHVQIKPAFEQKVQYVKDVELFQCLDPKAIKYIKSVTRTIMYYSRAVDPTIMSTLKEISVVRATPTYKTMKTCKLSIYYSNMYKM